MPRMLRPAPVPLWSRLAIPRLHPTTVGSLCCIVAALGYGAVNVCLRSLTVRCDRSLILLSRETLAAVCMGAWFLYWARREGFSPPRWRPLAGLVVVGVLTQLAASLPLLWAMAVVGLAISITLSLGTSLITSALLGRFLLGERVSGQSLLAIGLLIAAVILLTFGAERAAAVPGLDDGYGPLVIVLAAAASCGAGIVYGLLNVAVRRWVTGGMSAGFVALVVPIVGVGCLAPVSFWRLGVAGILATPPEDALVLLAAGLLNVIAWFAVVRGLERTSVLRANVLTASQVALAALAGVVIFDEAITIFLVAGILITIAGMVMIGRPAAQ